MPIFGIPANDLAISERANSATPAAYYLRMELVDKPGVLAKIASVLGDEGISIDRMRQYGHTAPTAPVLIVTHKAQQNALDQALTEMEATGVLAAAPVALRIEDV